MFQNKGELLDLCSPFSMSVRQFSFTVNVLQCLMIRIKNKIDVNQIVIPMPQGLNNGIEFYIISVVFQFCPIQLLTEIGH